MLPFLDKSKKKEKVLYEYMYIDDYIEIPKDKKKDDEEDEERQVIIDIF